MPPLPNFGNHDIACYIILPEPILVNLTGAIPTLDTWPTEVGHAISLQRIGDMVDLLPNSRAHITEVDVTSLGIDCGTEWIPGTLGNLDKVHT